jgi:feruloyl esterase
MTIRPHRFWLSFLIVSFFGAAPVGHAQNGSQFLNWRADALADGASLTPKSTCRALVSLTGYEFSIATVATMPANGNVPEFCRVTGQVLPEVRFEVSLPASWNGRLYMFGNGGFAGEVLESAGRMTTRDVALAKGFAVVQTNTGHTSDGPTGSFATNSQQFNDYAYRAVHVSALTAKRIAQAYYEALPRRSYFDGCSTGGRQGLMAAQRFPDDFDGILVGAPFLDFSSTMATFAWFQQALQANPITPAKLKILADKVNTTCDAIDGLEDRLIDDPRRCSFNPLTDLPKCENDVDGAACFTHAQAQALKKVYDGPMHNGKQFFPGWPLGAETGWTPWFMAPEKGRPTQVNFTEAFLRYMAFGPNPTYDWKTFNLETDLDKMQAARALLDATDPDLSRFKTRGGKMLMYFGWADNALNPNSGVRYYEAVSKQSGGSATDFFRLFMVPGMSHCRGGVGVSTFDALTPLVQWVEKGTAPATILGSRLVDGKVARTRPLCPYPEVAKYKGTGSIDEAANFTCAKP